MKFAGFDISSTGYKPTQKLFEGIREFPSPTNIAGVRSFFGLINPVSFAFSQAPIISPFSELLKHKSKFYRDEILEQLFQQSEAEIINSIQDSVRTFEINRPSCLTTNWSRTGIGFTLLQKHCECPFTTNHLCGPVHRKVVYAGSRFTRPAVSRYSPTEGEALAIKFVLESCRMFVLGCPN